MQLNKAEKLRFIINGEQKLFRILFKEKLFNIIPVYYSYDVNNILLLKFADNSIIIIANEDYVNSIGNKRYVIEILDNILRQKYENTIVDLHIANWISYSSLIEYLYDINKPSRAANIGNYIGSGINNSIRDMDYILNKFKYIEVG